jgi:hypothetical protein
MAGTSLEVLTEQVELSEQLAAGRKTMLEPQDLPGRFGRVVKAIDHLLKAAQIEALLAGGWAVWHHGYAERVTRDVDVVLAADRVDEFLNVASFSGFQVLPRVPGRWPKLMHKESGVKVDILPEGQRPGVASKLAPTTIRHPREMGASGTRLRYITLPALVELKIAARREQDLVDIIALLRANPDQVDSIRQHLERIHADYVAEFDRLVKRASEQDER